jgi:hypothetical protein
MKVLWDWTISEGVSEIYSISPNLTLIYVAFLLSLLALKGEDAFGKVSPKLNWEVASMLSHLNPLTLVNLSKALSLK